MDLAKIPAVACPTDVSTGLRPADGNGWARSVVGRLASQGAIAVLVGHDRHGCIYHP